MATIMHDIALQVTFRLVDDAGNTTGRHTLPPMVLDALTPLAALTLYETLCAKRNEVRKAAGLPEIGQPDAGLLALGFLRGMEELVRRGETPNLADMGTLFAELVREVQINRLEALPDLVPNGREPAEVTG